MAEQQKNISLTNKTVSNLLDFQSLPTSENSSYPRLVQTTTTSRPNNDAGQTSSQASWPQEKNRTLRKQVPTIKSQIFAVAAAILLLLIVWLLAGNKLRLPLRLEVIKAAYQNLFYICMLILAGCVFCFATWLYWKNRLTKTAGVTIVIVIILTISLPILRIVTGIETSKKGRLIKDISQFSFNSLAPNFELVTGIISSEDKPSAIIGTRIVHEGDSFNGIKIVKIDKDKVELEINGQRLTQTVGENHRATTNKLPQKN